ncbi:MAG: hypothetical protein L0I92_07245, partial [Staphylococcus equorum]|nr:hypothetical protein [Staphylococcus equorum]
DKDFESEKIPVPRFTTESNTNKELVFYFKDALTVEPMTAYDIAVRNGFTGTELEWVRSIKGEPGRDGEEGKDGIDGKSFKYTDFTASQLNELRMFIGGGEVQEEVVDKGIEDNLFVLPPNSEHVGDYAESINDVYFESFQSLKTDPTNSINSDSSMIVPPNGYFFYDFKAVEDIAPGKTFSLQVKTSSISNKSELEYSIQDEDGNYLTHISDIPNTEDGLYQLDNIEVPEGAYEISVRLDNRQGDSDLKVESLSLFAGGLTKTIQASSVDAIIKSLTTEVEKLRNDLKQEDKAYNTNYTKYVQPTDFGLINHLIDSKILTDNNGSYHVDFDVSSLKNIDGKTYYVSPNGDNSNDGLSKDTAKRDIASAMSNSDIQTLMLDGGTYFRPSSGIIFGNISSDLNIIAYNGKAKILGADNLNFTALDGYNNVKQAQRTAVSRVINLEVLDTYGDYTELQKVDSIDKVEETYHSWYSDSTNVYINGNINDIACLLNVDVLNISGDYNIYLENVEVIGGRRNVRLDSSKGSLVFNNCKLSYSIQSNGNGIEMVGGKYCISKNTEISQQMMDGFNYHKGDNGELPYFIEIDCVGRDNGVMKGKGGSRSDNGSTAHDGIKGIRVNGCYLRNDGGNLADVNEGTEALNLGCITSDGLQGYNNIILDSNCYYEFCKSYGNEKGMLINGSGVLYSRMNIFEANNINVDGKEIKY